MKDASKRSQTYLDKSKGRVRWLLITEHGINFCDKFMFLTRQSIFFDNNSCLFQRGFPHYFMSFSSIPLFPILHQKCFQNLTYYAICNEIENKLILCTGRKKMKICNVIKLEWRGRSWPVLISVPSKSRITHDNNFFIEDIFELIYEFCGRIISYLCSHSLNISEI